MTEDIRDIRGPIAEAVATPWWPYVIAALGVLALAVMVLAIVRARRKPLAAHERALLELAATRTYIEGGDPEAFSVRVSHAVRAYVESAFGIHAPRQTTAELLADLVRDERSPVAAYRGELAQFLEQCDLAKYARLQLAATAMTEMVDRAETFVRATAAPRGAS